MTEHWELWIEAHSGQNSFRTYTFPQEPQFEACTHYVKYSGTLCNGQRIELRVGTVTTQLVKRCSAKGCRYCEERVQT